MFWYIKANMENAYVMQSSRISAFLSDTIQPNGKRMFDNLRKRLDQFQALPELSREQPIDVEIIVPANGQKKPDRVNVTNEKYKEAD
jgi:hypothetical protein